MSKMGVNTVLRPAPRIGPGSALITPRRPGSTPDSSLHVRTPKPASSIRQRLQPSQDVFRSSQAPGETPARLPPGVRPRRCHCSLTSRSGPAPRPPLSLPPHPPPPPAPGARDPGASQAPTAQGSPLGPAGAAPPCALPNLPLLFQLPSLPRLRHRGGLQNVESGVTATPGIRRGRGASDSLSSVGRGARAGAQVCVRVQPVLFER